MNSLAAQGSGYVAMACPTHQGSCEIAQRCDDLGSAAGSYLRTVFVKGDVPYPMHPVFDVPMLPEYPQQTVRSGNGWG